MQEQTQAQLSLIYEIYNEKTCDELQLLCICKSTST